MSKISEMKSRVQHLMHLTARIRGQVARLSGPEGKQAKEKAKQEGKRIGIGVAVAIFGASVIAVAAVYILAVLMLILNIALDRLWLSSLIVVIGAFLFGGAVVAVGVKTIKEGAREMPVVGSEFVEEIKGTTEEMKETVGELQEIARQEAEEKQRQVQEVIRQVKPVLPYLVGAYLGYRVVKGVVRARRRRLLRMIKEMGEMD